MALRHKDTISFWILRPFERLPYFPYLLNRGLAHVAVLHKLIVRDCTQEANIYYLVSVLVADDIRQP